MILENTNNIEGKILTRNCDDSKLREYQNYQREVEGTKEQGFVRRQLQLSKSHSTLWINIFDALENELDFLEYGTKVFRTRQYQELETNIINIGTFVKHLDKDLLEKATRVEMIYKRYLGLAFEWLLREALDERGIKHKESKENDTQKQIDIKVIKGRRVLNLQCKSKTFLNAQREEYIKKCEKNKIKMIFYSFDDNFNPIITTFNEQSLVKPSFTLNKDCGFCLEGHCKIDDVIKEIEAYF